MGMLLAGASPARAYAATSSEAKKNEPVAVVYYRCELKGEKGKQYCTPHGGLHYVHNGVALEELPTAEHIARISHVAKWPATIDVYIYGETKAVDAAIQGPGKTSCCGSKEGTDIWRPWVWERIHPYPKGQPIAWTVDNDHENPHNGVFECFQKENSQICGKDIPAAGAKGTLEYWHFANPNYHQQGFGEARIAKHPNDFQLLSGRDPDKGDPDKSFTIAKQLPTPKLFHCP